MCHSSTEGAVCLKRATQSDLSADCGPVNKAMKCPSEWNVSACVLHCHVTSQILNSLVVRHISRKCRALCTEISLYVVPHETLD